MGRASTYTSIRINIDGYCPIIFGGGCTAATRKTTKATKEAIAIINVKTKSGFEKDVSPLFEAKVANIMHTPKEISDLPKIG